MRTPQDQALWLLRQVLSDEDPAAMQSMPSSTPRVEATV